MVGSQTTDRFNGVVASLAIKVPCKAVATSNITLEAAQTVSGVVVTGSDRVLCVGQTNAVENGIWIVDSSSAWSRSPDMDGNRDVTTDSIVVCNRSGSQAPVIYHMTSAMPLVVGVDENNWAVFIDVDITGAAEVNDLTAAVTWANIPDANVPESAVTQHEAALTIIEGQITSAAFSSWDSAFGWGNHAIAGYLKNVVEDTTPELGGNLDCLGKQVISSELSAFSVEDQVITDSGVVDLDYEAGQSIQLNPDGNITEQTFSNWPASECGQMEVELNQDNPARTIAWAAAIEWVDGTAPDITTASGKWLIHFRTRDGGTSVLGTYAGPFS